MLETAYEEESEPPEVGEDDDGEDGLSELRTNIRISEGTTFDLVGMRQYRHYPMPREVFYIVMHGENRSGWDMLFEARNMPRLVGQVYRKTRSAKLYRAGSALTKDQHNKLKKILVNAGYDVCVISNVL